MGVVSFRLPDDDEEALRRVGITPGALAKDLVESEVRRLRVARAKELGERYRRKPRVPLSRIVREIREEH